MGIWGNRVSHRGNSQCQEPATGLCRVCLRNSEEKPGTQSRVSGGRSGGGEGSGDGTGSRIEYGGGGWEVGLSEMGAVGNSERSGDTT